MKTKKTEKKRKFKLSPMKKIILGSIAIIFLGAFILTLPISSRDGIHTSFEDALFTSTSEMCIRDRISGIHLTRICRFFPNTLDLTNTIM